MCMGGGQKAPPPASRPAAAPPPPPDAPVAPIINDSATSNSKVMAANQAGRGGFKIDRATGVGPAGGSGLNIPT